MVNVLNSNVFTLYDVMFIDECNDDVEDSISSYGKLIIVVII